MVITFALVLCAYMWWRALQRKRVIPSPATGRAVKSWRWAFFGSAIGSFFGVAGFGNAIAGTIPGGIVGYVLGGFLSMKRQLGEDIVPEFRLSTFQRFGAAMQVLAPASTKLIRYTIVWCIGAALLAIAVLITVAFIEARQRDDADAAVFGTPPLTNFAPAADQSRSTIAGAARDADPGLPPDASMEPVVKSDTTRDNNNVAERRRFAEQFMGTTPKCEFKVVMTDDDYRICGNEPPATR